MTKCNQCRFDEGSNFCSHCGRITDQGKKVGEKPPCAVCGDEKLLGIVVGARLYRSRDGKHRFGFVINGREDWPIECYVRAVLFLLADEPLWGSARMYDALMAAPNQGLPVNTRQE